MENAHTLPGFRWMPGMSVSHVGVPLIVLRVDEDEWLGEPMYVLMAYNSFNTTAPLSTVFVKNETFLDLKHPATGGCLTELLGFLPQMNEGETLGEACARVATEQQHWRKTE
jgi:hypothetical protein